MCLHRPKKNRNERLPSPILNIFLELRIPVRKDEANLISSAGGAPAGALRRCCRTRAAAAAALSRVMRRQLDANSPDVTRLMLPLKMDFHPRRVLVTTTVQLSFSKETRGTSCNSN